uniref:SCP domain-containing protein n=1 Tax=Eutreptiella gymnastica TaxID=73025 RepID=A0A7S1IZG3_9EUGL|mmetsp:Transcript_54675/g.97224  ORF Transcript_54675/g.97224 Transcript_54675/m.97224 type:complete len:278 (+) Transcript_54675:51-884(+)
MHLTALSALLALCLVGVGAEFCASHLYTNTVLCDDGSELKAGSCCLDNGFCPSKCRSGSMSNGVCTCKSCPKARKLVLTSAEQWTRAHNYFRCRHGQPALEWSSDVATNAEKPATQSCSTGSLVHSNSYSMTPSAGENLAAGQATPEDATEAWYSEITSPGYTPGTRGGSGVGHYTALIWNATSRLGCADCMSGAQPMWACQYADAPPNYGGVAEYVKNVPQTNAPIATEAACCEKVYGGVAATTSATSLLNATGGARCCSPAALLGSFVLLLLVCK